MHGFECFAVGHEAPSRAETWGSDPIDDVPMIRRGGRVARDGAWSAPQEKHMDPRTPSEVDATGTLPLTGDDSVPVTAEAAEAAEAASPHWVEEARAGLTVPGKSLAYEDSGRRIVAPVSREWTRIGRSLSADIRFDDATVSRRHALGASQADGVRVLDDRSLNGVFVNGRRVEWAPLADGDEIAIGRHTIHFLDTAPVASAPTPSPAAVGD